MNGLERGIGEVFSAFEGWLVSTGATDSLMRLAWAVLTVVWLGHVAVSTRPGRDLDLIGAFGRLIVAGGLLAGIGTLTRVILLGFETFRGAGAAVLNGLIGQTWNQFVLGTLVPQFGQMLRVSSAWFVYPWAAAVFLAGAALGVILFAIGTAFYLAILFFAHLTLLLAIFLAPLAVALFAAPATQTWTLRWAVIVVRAGLVVFGVRVIHAAALYLAVIVPFRDAAAALPAPGTAGLDPLGLVSVLWRLTALLFLMFAGTLVGVYAMLRVEWLIGQFVHGAVFQGDGGGLPLWSKGQVVAARRLIASGVPDVNLARGGGGFAGPGTGATASENGGAQEATVIRGHRRSWQ
jgi:hypothetical protein